MSSNEFVKQEIKNKNGKLGSLLNTVKIRKLKWHGHVVRNKGALLGCESCKKKWKELEGEEDQAESSRTF